MTVSVYKNIRAALETRLSSLPSIPPIAWENVDFNPTTGVTYVRARLVNTARVPAVRGINPQNRYQGVFQVLVYSPEGQGPDTNQTVANIILDGFQTGEDYSSNGAYVTIENSEQRGSYNNSPWFVTPVNINWFCFS